ncbi:MAG: hypothetical protein ACHQX3_03760 [Nitrospirales bacterium]
MTQEDLKMIFYVSLTMVYFYLSVGVWIVVFRMGFFFNKNKRVRWGDLDLIDPFLRVKMMCIIIVYWFPLMMKGRL